MRQLTDEMLMGGRSPLSCEPLSGPKRSPSRVLKKGVGGVASAAATACGGWPFARGAFDEKSLHCEKSSLRRELQKARHDTRIHFSAAC